MVILVLINVKLGVFPFPGGRGDIFFVLQINMGVSMNKKMHCLSVHACAHLCVHFMKLKTRAIEILYTDHGRLKGAIKTMYRFVLFKRLGVLYSPCTCPEANDALFTEKLHNLS